MVQCSNCQTCSTESRTFCVLRASHNVTFDGRPQAPQPRRSSRPPSHRPTVRVVAQQLHGHVEGAEDPSLGSAFRGERPFSPPKSSLPGQQAAQVHQAHLQRSTSSGTRAAAMTPDREWTHGLHIPQCHICLARFTRRASSSPALLALLPLREQVLRERPARCSPPSSCDKDWGEKHKHTRSDNVVVAVAVQVSERLLVDVALPSP